MLKARWEMVEVIREDYCWTILSDDFSHHLPVSDSINSLISEEYETFGGAIVRYGNRVLLASLFREGEYFAAVYECADDCLESDSRLNLIWVNGELHKDAGHAIEACINWCRHN